MKHHDNSSELNLPYICTYTDFKKTKLDSVSGYKLVLDFTENFYSVGTGLYRYKLGKVKRRNENYSSLYKKEGYYYEEMKDKTAVFTSLKDLYAFYPNADNDKRVSVMKFTLSGDIVQATAENQFHTCNVFAGSKIDKMERHV